MKNEFKIFFIYFLETLLIVSCNTQVQPTKTDTAIPKQTNTRLSTATLTPLPTTTSFPTFDTISDPLGIPNPVLIHNGSVLPETLARIVGGDAEYWWQQVSLTWIYKNEGRKTLMHHPGENMIFFVVNHDGPQNADDCQIYDSHVNNGSGMIIKYIKCPSGTDAWIETDTIGLMLFDITGYFN